MAPSRGSGKATATPPKSVPRRTVRRESTLRPKSISFPPALRLGSDETKAVVSDQIDQQLIDAISGVDELTDQLIEGVVVDADGQAAQRVFVNLADDARPGDGVVSHGHPELREVAERDGIERARGVEGLTVVGRPVLSRRVEVLHAESDRVHEPMAGGAQRRRAVRAQDLPHHRAGRGHRWQGWHPGRGRRYGLAKKHLVDEFSTQGR